MKAPSLIEATEDAMLLGGGVELWPRQREILHGIATHRETVLALGRRSSKSYMAADWVCYDACFRDLREFMRPGEMRTVQIVANSQPQARIVLNFARDILRQSPLLADCIESETADSITVRQPGTGALVTIQAAPCSSRTTRGPATSTVVFDELAHFLDATEGPAVAERVYRALTPATAQFGEAGRIISISTPWGSSGLFADLFERARSEEATDSYAVQAATWQINPTIPKEFFDRERERDPESFATEFAAEFREGGGAFLDWNDIQSAVGREGELPPGLDLVSPVAALDPGFAKDPFTLAIVGRHPEQRDRLRVALVKAWKPRKGSELQVEDVLDQIAEICVRYRVSTCWTDQYASAPVRQSLRSRGLTAKELTMTATSKTAIYNTLRSKLAASELELYNQAELLAELGRIEVRYSANSAGVHIPRRGGSHGDLAQALALAVHTLRKSGGTGRLRIRSGGYTRDALGRSDPLTMSVLRAGTRRRRTR